MGNPISVRIGISSCLLGENVRYDGRNKLDLFLRDTLGRYVVYVPVCPEVECGLGMPREAMHLRGDPVSPRLFTIHTNQDITDRMVSWARGRAVELEREDLCGFIFKSGSPSCGTQGVPVCDNEGVPVPHGRGLFARAFMELFPLLPVEEDGRLHDPVLRERFMERITLIKYKNG